MGFRFVNNEIMIQNCNQNCSMINGEECCIYLFKIKKEGVNQVIKFKSLFQFTEDFLIFIFCSLSRGFSSCSCPGSTSLI